MTRFFISISKLHKLNLSVLYHSSKICIPLVEVVVVGGWVGVFNLVLPPSQKKPNPGFEFGHTLCPDSNLGLGFF